MKVALLSLDASLGFNDRLRKIEELISSARSKEARVVVLPEMSYGGYMATPLAGHKEDGFGFFSKLALKYGVYIAFGTIRDFGEKFKNSLLVVSDKGELISEYDKIHIFSFANEDKSFEGGENLAWVEIEGLTFGLSICYDLRFAEMYSLYSKTCDAVLCIAAWPKKRIANFKLLLKVRALENLTPMLGVNWQGTEYIKSSHVANTTGAFQKPLFESVDMDIYEIGTKTLPKTLPNTIEDKRFALYAKFYSKEQQYAKR